MGIWNTHMTDIGQQSLLNIQAGGYTAQVTFNHFRIGSDAGFVFNPADLDVKGSVVYTGSSNLSFSKLANNLVRGRLYLGFDIGDFNVGNIGLFDNSNRMIFQAIRSASFAKRQQNLPTEYGNDLEINFILAYNRISNMISTTLSVATPADLPVVNSVLELPAASVSVHKIYAVNSLPNGQPGQAFTDGTRWWYSSFSSTVAGNFPLRPIIELGVNPTVADIPVNQSAIVTVGGVTKLWANVNGVLKSSVALT